MGKRNLWIRSAIIISIIIFAFGQASALVSGTATATPSTISAGQTSQLNCIGAGGSGTYYYSWSSLAPGFISNIQNPVVAPNVTTTYTCQVFNGGQVGYASVTVYVSGAASLSATATATPPSIMAGQPSQLNCNPVGGSGTYTYSWISAPAGFTSALKNPVVSPLINTTYTCTVTCGTQTTTANTTVTVTPLLDGVVTAIPQTIIAGQTSQLNCEADGGTGTYTYSWTSIPAGFTSNLKSPVVSPLVNTTYACLVTSGSQSYSESVQVLVYPLLSAVATATPATITSGQSSQLNCNPSGGTGTYSYSWISSPTGFTSTLKSPVVSPVINTTYTCTVTCGTQTATANKTVTVTPLLDGVVTAIPQTIIAGQTSQLNCEADGGTGTYTYSWTSIPAGFTSNLKSPVVSPLVNTTYACLVTSGSQSYSESVQVLVYPLLSAVATATPAAITSGQSSQLNCNPSGGTGTYSYSWISSPAGFTSTLKSPVVSPLVNTTYTCAICSGTQNISTVTTVTVGSIPALSIALTATPTDINPGQTSALNCNPTGGTGTYTYSWTSNPAGFTSSLKSPVVAPTVTTIYTCSVTSGSQNASAVVTVRVNVTPVLTVTTSATPSTITLGQTTQLNCTANGGTSTYNYAWTSVPAGFTSTLQSPVATPTVNTTYTCTVTSGTLTGSCLVSVTVIPVTLTVSANANPGNIYRGQSSRLTCNASGGTGNYTYAWTSNPVGFTSNLRNPMVSPKKTTTYTVTVNDGNTTKVATVKVYVWGWIWLTAAIDNPADGPVCKGQSTSVSVIASGGRETYTYSWSSVPAGITSHEQSLVITPEQSLHLVCEVSDGDSTVIVTTDLIVNPSPTSFAGEDITVKPTNDAIPLNGIATGYSTVLWTSDGDGVFSNSASLIGEYTPGPSDLVKGSVKLSLLANAAVPCTESVSSERMLTFSATISIPDPTADNYSVLVYPNPTAGLVHVKFTGNESADATAAIMDVQGKVLQTKVLRISEGGEISFDLSGYVSGFYFIRIRTGEYTKIHKVIRY